MSQFSKPVTDSLGHAIAALTDSRQTLAFDALPHLTQLAQSGHHIRIDLTASRTIGAPVIIAQPAPNLSTLTPRQREVAQAITRGASNKDIARTLDISPATVKDHVHAILKRLGLTRRGQIAAHIYRSDP